MKRFTPKEKLSKKEKRKLDLSGRVTWGAINPVTRKPPNPKAYDRKKVRREEKFFSDEPPFFVGCPVYSRFFR